MPSALSFDTIRTWDGSQSRAFEELAFQLLKESAPTGSRAVRTGNPDGGVEWYAVQPDGTEVGWQAKHTHGIDSLLSGMTASVESVVVERPNLRKLIFVISENLSTGTSGGERKSARKKYTDKVAAWQRDINGAAGIEFELIQGSDLLSLLAQPAHQGRKWFWWGGTVLDDSWLRGRLQEQEDAAGEKYRPDLQVDIPIQDDLVALGFGNEAQQRFSRLIKAITDAVSDLRIYPKGDAAQLASYQQIQQSSANLADLARRLVVEASDRSDTVADLIARAHDCQTAIGDARSREHEIDRVRERLEKDDPERDALVPSDIARGRSVGDVDDAIERLIDWLDASEGRAFLSSHYFLSGQAGSGKTHLFLDATRRALEEGRPAAFLAGARLGSADLWASMTDQLGLAGIGGDILLDAMDSAAEAASLTGRRFVIFIDALNETSSDTFWHAHLPALRAAVGRRQHVALAVSCRGTYLPIVAETEERARYVFREHPGFAEREDEAAAKYFAHYGLEAPRIPLLTPEFVLPLFLRLYCESLAGSGDVAVGHESRIRTFERYIRVKVKAVARRITQGARTDLELEVAQHHVEDVLDRLLDKLVSEGTETLALTTMLLIVQERLDCDESRAARIVGALQDEGILTRERLYLGGGASDEGVRIVFQAFSDFMILRRRLGSSDEPMADQSVLAWLRDHASFGIIEAASIALPEAYGHELVNLLELDIDDIMDRLSAREDDWEHLNRLRWIVGSTFETLPYRASESVTQETIDFINQARGFITREKFFKLFFLIAPQPGNRLNGDRFHHYLARHSMPKRDGDFGFATYHEALEPGSPASRLARWAARGPYPSYEPGVIELASIPLCWLFSSPNRFQRDWITKALSQLLRGHLDIAALLVRRFWSVNDPYVVQRVMVTAYGALLKSDSSSTDAARDLAQTVLELVFATPVRADEVLLDAARGIVRVAVARDLLPADALATSHRPYGIAAPRNNPPTEKTLEAKYGVWEDIPAEKSYRTVYGSIYGMGDFGRYVVEAGARQFSAYRLGAPIPEPKKPKAQKVSKAAWERFITSLSAEQLEGVAKLVESVDEPTQQLGVRFNMSLSSEQRALFDALGSKSRRRVMPAEYPSELAKRWVLARTISLGWQPDIFGKRDRVIAHSRHGREAHKSERWGKKYQWIAFHELIARLADNFHPSGFYGDEVHFHSREIDPSLPPLPYEVFAAEDGESLDADQAWGQPPHRVTPWPPSPINFEQYRGEIEAFTADEASEPHVETMTRAIDDLGREWIVLEGSLTQIDPKAVKGWQGLQQRASVDSWLVPAGTAADLVAGMANRSANQWFDFEDRHGHIGCCYVGEIGRAGPNCYHRFHELLDAEIGDSVHRVVPSTEGYLWESSGLDCSIQEAARGTLPSTFLQVRSVLTFDPDGPSWNDASGEVAYQYYWERDQKAHGLLVRSTHLAEVLARFELELVTSTWFERMTLGGSMLERREPYSTASEVAWVDASLTYRPTRVSRTLGRIESVD